MDAANQKQPDPVKGQMWLSLLAEVNAEIASRRQPEYLYTASAIAAFGAVTWGVAALTTRPQRQAIAAGIGTLVVALLIGAKIVIEHGHYKMLRTEQRRLGKKIAEAFVLEIVDLPYAYQAESEVVATFPQLRFSPRPPWVPQPYPSELEGCPSTRCSDRIVIDCDLRLGWPHAHGAASWPVSISLLRW